MKILAVDTSAKVSSVCVMSEKEILAEFDVNAGLTHSETLMPMCQSLLDCCKLKLSDIEAFAVSVGPGSFTGLRIGISAVKGMALSLEKPCIAVSTLEALAQNVNLHEGIICAVMDARCNQVYCALFESNLGTINRIMEDNAISIDELNKILTNYEKNIILVGDGAELCYNNLNAQFSNLFLAPLHLRMQKASGVGLVGINSYSNNTTIKGEDLMPSYLRLPQAQREREERLKQRI